MYDYYSLLLLLLSRLISSIGLLLSYYLCFSVRVFSMIKYYYILLCSYGLLLGIFISIKVLLLNYVLISGYYWLWFIGFIRIKFLLSVSIYYWINWYIVISLLSIYLTFIGFIKIKFFRFIRNILFRFNSLLLSTSLWFMFKYYSILWLLNSYWLCFKYWIIKYKCYIYKLWIMYRLIYWIIIMFYRMFISMINYRFIGIKFFRLFRIMLLLILLRFTFIISIYYWLLLLAFSSSNNSFSIISNYSLISILAFSIFISINIYSLTFSAFNIYNYCYSSLLSYRVINILFICSYWIISIAISSSSNSIYYRLIRLFISIFRIINSSYSFLLGLCYYSIISSIGNCYKLLVLGSIDFVMGSVDCWWWSFAPLLMVVVLVAELVNLAIIKDSIL